MTEELKPKWKPCPHCRSMNIFRRYRAYANGEPKPPHDVCIFECADCGSQGPMAMNWGESLNLWNQRHERGSDEEG